MIRTNSCIEKEKSKLNKIIIENIKCGRKLVNDEVLKQSRFVDELVLEIARKEYDFASMKLFEQYLSPIHDGLYRYIFKIAGDQSLADDIMQNTLIIAYKHIKDLEDFNKFKNWIFKIGKNEALKAKISLKKDDLKYQKELQAQKHITVSSPDELIVNKEFEKALIVAINSLKPKFRSVIIYKYYSNLTLEEIAKVMDVSISSVKVWHMRAKKEIEEYLREVAM